MDPIVILIGGAIILVVLAMLSPAAKRSTDYEPSDQEPALAPRSAPTSPQKTSRPQRDLSLPRAYVVFDLETTGLSANQHEIIEIGAIRHDTIKGTFTTFQTFVIPEGRVSAQITQLTGITHEMALSGMPLDVTITEFREFVGKLPLVAFNARFDTSFLEAACRKLGHPPFENKVHCALELSRQAWPGRGSYKLSSLAMDAGLEMNDEHRALGDCHRTIAIYGAAWLELLNRPKRAG